MMKNRSYQHGELEQVACMLTDMLKERRVFTSSAKDFAGAHIWMKDTLGVLGREYHLRDMEAYMTRLLKQKRVHQIRMGERWTDEQPLSSEVKPTAAWNHAVMEQRSGVKYGAMLTLWLHLYWRFGRSWTRDIPNRFYFAEVSPGSFQYIGHDYPL